MSSISPTTQALDRAHSHLQDVTIPRYRTVEHWIDKEAQQQTRYQASDDHDREGFLRI